jgi:hypothetical protein
MDNPTQKEKVILLKSVDAFKRGVEDIYWICVEKNRCLDPNQFKEAWDEIVGDAYNFQLYHSFYIMKTAMDNPLIRMGELKNVINFKDYIGLKKKVS